MPPKPAKRRKDKAKAGDKYNHVRSSGYGLSLPPRGGKDGDQWSPAHITKQKVKGKCKQKKSKCKWWLSARGNSSVLAVNALELPQSYAKPSICASKNIMHEYLDIKNTCTNSLWLVIYVLFVIKILILLYSRGYHWLKVTIGSGNRVIIQSSNGLYSVQRQAIAWISGELLTI